MNKTDNEPSPGSHGWYRIVVDSQTGKVIRREDCGDSPLKVEREANDDDDKSHTLIASAVVSLVASLVTSACFISCQRQDVDGRLHPALLKLTDQQNDLNIHDIQLERLWSNIVLTTISAALSRRPQAKTKSSVCDLPTWSGRCLILAKLINY